MLEAGNAAEDERFGRSVAISGRTIAVGADKELKNPDEAGEVYLFTLERNDYEEWARAEFGNATVNDTNLEAGTWGAYADPDDDDLPNLMEAYIGLDPQNDNPNFDLLRDFYLDAGAGEIALQWRRARDYHDVIAEVQWSPDLRTWYLAGDGPAGAPLAFAVGAVEADVNHHFLEARASATNHSPVFLRLRLRKQ
jgi:hypothetical protein